jgi:P-type E1-E2 ATPase
VTVPVAVEIPGREPLRLEAALLDVNGTLTDRGELIDGVAAAVAALAFRVRVVLVSADTFGTVAAIAASLGVEHRVVEGGEAKVAVLDEVGRDTCAVVGNGSNDAPALAASALGIVVLGPEGASRPALEAGDVVCATVLDALRLLTD